MLGSEGLTPGRTNEDKRRAVRRLLRDEEWAQWSDREIARRCQVSQPFVSKLRAEAASDNDYQIRPTRKVRRGGTVYEQNTERIGTTPDPVDDVSEADDEPVVSGPRPARVNAPIAATDRHIRIQGVHG